jgi:hypothetical protein
MNNIVQQGLKIANNHKTDMNSKTFYILDGILFFSILILTTIFLFSSDIPKSLKPTVSAVVMKDTPRSHIYPTQGSAMNPADCFGTIMNGLQSGNLNFGKLQEDMDKCLQLDLNNESDNNTEVIPQPQDGNDLQIV